MANFASHIFMFFLHKQKTHLQTPHTSEDKDRFCRCMHLWIFMDIDEKKAKKKIEAIRENKPSTCTSEYTQELHA